MTCASVVLVMVALCPRGPEDLTYRLQSKKAEVRVEAVKELAWQDGDDDDVEQTLIQSLKDTDWEVVEEAARALGRRGRKDAIKPLAKVAIHGDIRRVRAAAAQALRELKSDDAAKYVIDDELKKQPVRALEFLARLAPLGGKQTVEAIEEHLGSREVPVRVAAAGGLAALPIESRIAWLKTLAEDRHLEVYATGLTALRAQPDAEMLAPLLQSLAPPRLNDVIARRIVAAIVAIVESATPEQNQTRLDELSQILPDPTTLSASAAVWVSRLYGRIVQMDLARSDPPEESIWTQPVFEWLQPYREHTEAGVRSAAITATGLIPAPTALTAVCERAQQDENVRVRVNALRAAVMNHTAENPVVLQLAMTLSTEDPSERVREEAVVALGVRGHPEVLKPLQQALADSAWTVAVCAAVSLGKTGQSEAVEPLRELAESRDWKLNSAAVVGLGHLRRPTVVPDLIDSLSSRDRAKHWSAWEFLRRLTSDDVAAKKTAWTKWWKNNADSFAFPDVSDDAKRFGYAAPPATVYQNLDITVFQSRGDHIEFLLDELEIEYRTTRSGTVGKEGVHPFGIFVSNCSGECNDDDIEHINWFVRTGGYLFCSCWALTHTAAKVYPGVIQQQRTRNQVMDHVRAEPCPVESPYLRGVFAEMSQPMYALEGAHLIQVLDRERAEILIDSPECATRWGSGNLAAWFSVGHGVILDSVNHFDLQGLAKAKHLKQAKDRMIFAMDHMGLTYEELRELARRKIWANQSKSAEVARDLSAFRFITNFVRQKRRQGL